MRSPFARSSGVPLLALILASTYPCAVLANPQGGTVAAGSASISSSGNTVTINQSSDKAVIDWRGFDIQSNETTNFQQPTNSSITLNRVSSASASIIDGKLNANGNLIIVNQNGVLFGKNAQINVNGLLATTADIDNGQFMAGNLNFNKPGNPNATVENQGMITAQQAGLVGLVAPNVLNSGIINAKLGRVHLASGDTFTVDFYGDGLLEVQASPALQSQLVSNTGTISAQGGTIAMTAAAAGAEVNSLIHAGGTLDATAVGTKDGNIYIYAEGSNAVPNNVASAKGQKTGTSTVTVDGNLDASSAMGQGGTINILGDNVTLASTATVKANGATGGGTINIGGQTHGAGTTPTALTTTIEAGAFIQADATANGNGGNITVWSDGDTFFAGGIEATGGANGGNGGFVETSGAQIDFTASMVNAGAAKGAAGTWLIDPQNLTITTAGANNIDNVLNAGTNVTATTSSCNASYGTCSGSTGNITVSAPISETTGGASGVTLSLIASSGTLVIGSTISGASGNPLNLTLSATGYISDTANITTDGGNLVVRSNSGSTAAANTTFAAIDIENVTIQTGGGYIIFGGGSASDGNGNPTGYANSSGSRGIYLNAVILNAGGGNISIEGQTSSTYAAVYTPGSTISTTGSGTVNISAINTSSGPGLRLGGATAISSGSGAITLTGTGGTNNIGIELADANNIIYSTSGNITLIGSGKGSGSDIGTGGSANSIGTNGSGVTTTGNVTLNAIGVGGYTLSSTTSIAAAGAGTIIINAGAGAFVNQNVASPFSLGTGRWLIYSANPTGDTFNGLTGNFNRYTCSYSGSCPSFSSTGNGLLYSYTPILTVTPTALSNIIYGSAAPSLAGYGYSISGYVGTDSGNDILTGSLAGSTAYTQGSNIGSYNISYVSGSLASALGYGFSYTNNTNAITVVAKTLTASLVNGVTKIYNGTTSAILAAANYSLNGIYGSDTVSINSSDTSGTYGSKDVANNLSVSVSGLTLSGTQASNYVLASTSVSGNVGSITPATLTGIITANNKIYNNTTAATLASQTLSGTTYGSDASNLTLTSTGATFNSKDVLTATTVTAAGLSLSGSAAMDYQLASTTATASASITPATLTGVITANNKVYDDTTVATPRSESLSGTTYGSDASNLYLEVTAASFNSKDVATATTVTATGLALGGSAAGDYQLSAAAATASASITPVTLTDVITANNKTYDGTTTATLASQTLTGTIYGSDASNLTLTNAGVNFNTKDVLTATTVTASGLGLSGSAADDYQLSSATATASASITPATLTGTITANNKAYDGTTTATLATRSFSGTIYGSDASHLALTDTAANFNTADVLTANTVIATGLALSGTAASDYQLSSTTATASASITPATLTAAITANNKTYDGTTIATLATQTLNGTIYGSDASHLTLTGTAANFNTKDVLTATTVTATGFSLSGTAASDYQLSSTSAAASASITPATLTGAVTANNKVYDGTTTATLTTQTLSGTVYGSDASHLTLTDAAAHFNTADVLTANTVTATGLALSGTAAGDYQLSSTNATASANITPATLTGVITANNKVYDGTTLATPRSESFSGTVYGSDSSNLFLEVGSAGFNSKDVATANLVTATGLTLGGSAASDYQLSATTASAAASITPATLTGNITADNKTYDGTTTATLASQSFTGTIYGSDANNLTLTDTAANFNTKDVLTANTVTATGLALAGTAAGDYQLSATSATASANITPAILTGTVTANNKVYDGTTTATLATETLSGTIYGSDAGHLTLINSAATYNTADVLTANTVTATGLSLSGTAASDYQLAATTATASASITPATLTAAITANNKVYDGTPTATLASGIFTGTIYGSDGSNLALAAAAANFNTKDVLTANTVTATGLSLNGSAAGDYQLSSTSATATANITPATLTGVITANNKVYNGTTTATLATETLSGTVYGSDASHLTLTNTAANFNTADVLTANTVTASGLVLTGTAANDYQLSAATAAAAANITPATVTGVITATNKVYDGTTTATPQSESVTGTTYGSDGSNLFLQIGAATYNSKDVATANLVTATGLTLGGTAASNYQLASSSATASAGITKATLTVMADSPSIIYGTSVPVDTISYSNFANGETAANLTTAPTTSTTQSGILNAGTYTNAYTVAGGSSGNYTFVYVDGNLTVQPRSLTVTTNSQTITVGDATPVFTGSNNLIAQDIPLISWAYMPIGYSTGDTGSYIIGSHATDPDNRLANYSITYNNGIFTVNVPNNNAPATSANTPPIASNMEPINTVDSQVIQTILTSYPQSINLLTTSTNGGVTNSNGTNYIYAINGPGILTKSAGLDLDMTPLLLIQLGYIQPE